jgi:tetratricopeptide (TPR) repeat protein
MLAEELCERGKLAEAETCYRKAMEIADTSDVCEGTLADMKIALARVLAAQRKLRQAERCLLEVMCPTGQVRVHPVLEASARAALREISVTRRRSLFKTGLLAGLLATVSGVVLLFTDVPEMVWEQIRSPGKNEVLMSEAFAAFVQGDYATAKDRADECVKEFRADAERLQSQLVADKADEPPIGSTSKTVRRQLLKNGLLNDVATCLWLSGRCERNLGHIEEARQLYSQSKKLTYARCWDPRTQQFWSPGLKASDDLESLEEALSAK